MTLPVISLLFFGSGVILISFFVLLKRWDPLSRSWLYFSITVSLYAFGYAYFSNNNASAAEALWASRMGTTSAAVIPLTWLYFVCIFLNISQPKAIWLIGFVSLLLISVGMTDLFIPRVAPAKYYLHYPVPGPFYYLHTVNFIGVVSYGFFLMAHRYYQNTQTEIRKEILSLAIATVIGFIAGGSEFSLILLRDKGIDLTVFLFIYPFLIAYAMIHHRVLDVEKIADAFQKEKLAAIGILSASVNHELKNPLFIARATLERLLKKLPMKTSDEDLELFFRDSCQKSIAQLDRAVEIMQGLTEFARPRSDESQFEKLSIDGLFTRVLELTNTQFGFNKIKLIKQIEGGLAAWGDKRQIEEILFNLILNACQAMPFGGDLLLKAYQDRHDVRIEIQDSGKGISTLSQDQIFEPFHTTKGKNGTGLGLYITRQLVKRNKGKIWFDSSEKGTTFHIKMQSQNENGKFRKQIMRQPHLN